MRVIIIGAGTGQRIGSATKQIPKCLIQVNSKTILENQISLFTKNNITDIIVITGPYSEKFTLNNLTYVHDTDFSKHDILGSLMEAQDFINDDVLVVYSDILFDQSILNQILDFDGDIGIAVDLDWTQAYEDRTEHPKSEAENVMLDDEFNLIKIQKNIENKNNTIGEFLGIIKLTSKGCTILNDKFNKLKNTHSGIFHTAPSLNKAYLTDMIQELLDTNAQVQPILIKGKWCEIDTMQDLNRAGTLFP
jgi:L-glutamine-phosphate cytidylyltransferase